MFGFGRKRRKPESQGNRTFVEATGGGWGEPPVIIAANGGEHADYVDQVLRSAGEYARTNGVSIGEEFEFTITDIPDVTSPHEITFGILMRSDDYGLACSVVADETARFVRMQ